MEQIIDKQGILFDLELLKIDPHTGSIVYLYSEKQNAGKESCIYDQSSLMRVLLQKAQVASEDIINEFYHFSDSELAFVLAYNSFEQIVCLIHIHDFKPQYLGQIVTILKKHKAPLLVQARKLIEMPAEPVQAFNTGARSFPRYSTENLKLDISIHGITNEIKMTNASVGGFCLKVAVPSAIIETTKKIDIKFSKFNYNFMITSVWTQTDMQRNTSAGFKIDFQTKQELSNWKTFIYALYVKNKK